MKEKNANKPKLRGDVIFIAAILLLAALGATYLFVFRKSGNMVKVTVDGKLYGSYLLSEPAVVEIKTGENGQHLNRLVIMDGKAFVEEATCPDGICVSHYPIFRDSESIVCLPNRVVITVVTQGPTDAPDLVI